MSLAPGTRLGAYEVTAKIGQGGMGEVYRARDTKLGRDVALKVLPDSFASDPDRLARFQREAHVLAALNHPNIAIIYGLEEGPLTGGSDVQDPLCVIKALVMELVEGEDLSQRIARGALPLDDALPIARQIAEALEAAHEQGIIHRDLKPANIKVRPDGLVKVLDFGLAKAVEPAGSKLQDPAYALSQAPTITSPALMTGAGVILGTAAYMSPEQAVGKTADKRSDLWAFGVVLMEMLTGRPVFTGETVSHVLAAVLKSEPDWTTLPVDTPPALRTLLRRCLQKDRKRRLADASDARLEIEEAASGAAAATPAARPARTGRREAVAWTLAALAVVAAAVLGAAYTADNSGAPAEPETATSLTIEPPPGTRFLYGPDQSFAVSPDGKSLVFSAIDDDGQSQLWLRRLDELDARPIPGTARAVSPFFSPDSRAIGFMVDRQLRRLDLSGGLSTTILETSRPNLRGANWTSNGTILLGSWGDAVAIAEIPATGGQPKEVTTPVPSEGDQTHRFPVLLPDGRHLLYVVRAKPGRHGIFVSEVGQSERLLVIRALTSFAFTEPGWLLYGDAGRLLAVPFDATTAEVTGEPRVMAPSVAHWAGSTKTEFSASARAVAFRRGSNAARIDKISPSGTLRTTVVPRGEFEGSIDLSPNGRTVAYAVVDPDTGRRGIWLGDVERRTQRRLTEASVNVWRPVWSPDGTRLAVNVDGTTAIVGVDAAPEPEPVKDTPNTAPRDWSADGRLVLEQTVPGRQTDIVLYDLAARRTTPIAASPANEANGTISPSGTAVAYASNESGRDEIYLRALTGGAAPVQLSTRGGSKPTWARDGQEVYYLAPSGSIMAARVRNATGGSPGEPRILFQADLSAWFVVAPDGDLVVQYSPDNLLHPNISVIVNWQRLLDPAASTTPRK